MLAILKYKLHTDIYRQSNEAAFLFNKSCNFQFSSQFKIYPPKIMKWIETTNLRRSSSVNYQTWFDHAGRRCKAASHPGLIISSNWNRVSVCGSNLEQKQWNRGSNSINFPAVDVWAHTQETSSTTTCIYIISSLRRAESARINQKPCNVSKTRTRSIHSLLLRWMAAGCERGTKEHKLGRYLRGPMVIKGQWCRCGATNSHTQWSAHRQGSISIWHCFFCSWAPHHTNMRSTVCLCLLFVLLFMEGSRISLI